MRSSKELSLAHFEVFLVVVEKKSFTDAAKHLGVTKASISHAVKILEEELGTPLLIRTTRSMHLTHEGELFLSQCLKLKYELDSTRDLIKGFHSDPKGRLKISCNPMLSETLLLPKIIKYKQKYPNIDLDITIEERMPDIINEKIDLVFGVNWPAPDDIIARKISSTRYVLCVSPSYLSIHGTPKSVEDLKNHTYIPHSGRDNKTPLVSLKIDMVNLNLSPKIQSNSIEFIKSCVLAGLGIAQFHEYVVLDDIKQGKLIELFPGDFKGNEPLFIYYQKHRFVQPKVKELVKIILDG